MCAACEAANDPDWVAAQEDPVAKLWTSMRRAIYEALDYQFDTARILADLLNVGVSCPCGRRTAWDVLEMVVTEARSGRMPLPHVYEPLDLRADAERSTE
jgi:hypothetical protein